MTIVDMKQLSEAELRQAAQMLVDELPQGWETLAEAEEEISDLLAEDADASLIAAKDNDQVIGWCGILPEYNGKVFELHPLVVRRDYQRRGVGQKLMERIEQIARERGGLTMYLGADDELPVGETSFANVDLYDNLTKRIEEFDPGTHQTAFYLKLGYQIVGVLPDANGIGKPDIFMAKRLY